MSDLALTSFDHLPLEVRALGLRRLLRLVGKGAFPRFVRLAPHGPRLWATAAVDAWLHDKMAALIAEVPS